MLRQEAFAVVRGPGTRVFASRIQQFGWKTIWSEIILVEYSGRVTSDTGGKGAMALHRILTSEPRLWVMIMRVMRLAGT